MMNNWNQGRQIAAAHAQILRSGPQAEFRPQLVRRGMCQTYPCSIDVAGRVDRLILLIPFIPSSLPAEEETG